MLYECIIAPPDPSFFSPFFPAPHYHRATQLGNVGPVYYMTHRIGEEEGIKADSAIVNMKKKYAKHVNVTNSHIPYTTSNKNHISGVFLA